MTFGFELVILPRDLLVTLISKYWSWISVELAFQVRGKKQNDWGLSELGEILSIWPLGYEIWGNSRHKEWWCEWSKSIEIVHHLSAVIITCTMRVAARFLLSCYQISNLKCISPWKHAFTSGRVLRAFASLDWSKREMSNIIGQSQTPAKR